MQNLKDKIVMVLALIYVICPVDFIPDVIPIIGWIDDLIAIVLGIKAAWNNYKSKAK